MSIDIGKSVSILLAKRKKKTGWLAKELGISQPSASMIKSRRYATCKRIEELAEIFEMSESDFICEGES